MLFKNVFHDKKILITGNTGFKGSWLSIWLKQLGADVYGLSVDIPTKPSNYEICKLNDKIPTAFIDIKDFDRTLSAINNIKPDIIFHLAAQPLVKESYKNPKNTFETNTIGTLNILESLRITGNPCIAVFITSDKCYNNVEWVWGYRETDELGGEDPYSGSKGAAELVIRSYVKSYFAHAGSGIKVVSVRAGNVIGGGDWAIDRIIPDAVRAWSKSEKLVIRNPKATRPWQHVLEPLSGYLLLASHLLISNDLNGEAFNFGPNLEQSYSVEELLNEAKKHWSNVSWQIVLDDSKMKESVLLKLNCDKAEHFLNWRPNLNFYSTVKLLVEWYLAYYSGKNIDMYQLTKEQIEYYVMEAKKKGLEWTK